MHVDDDSCNVRITAAPACASCHAKGVCSAAGQEEKFLDVKTGGQCYEPGETVRVLVARRLGYRAVALGYFLPFLVLMSVLIICLSAGVPELRAGSWALLSVIPYYLALFLARKRISKNFSFSIQKTKLVQ